MIFSEKLFYSMLRKKMMIRNELSEANEPLMAA
jgi:hypothetical protein